jgi:hypothetical protein
MSGSLIERYLLLVAGRLPADECGVLATAAGEAAATEEADTDCLC